MLTVQIGRSIMKNRFIVTDTLKSSPILLGSDFMVNHDLSVSPYNEKDWYVTIGPLDNQISRVPAFVTNKIIFNTKESHEFEPFETKKISYLVNDGIYKKELFKVYGTDKTFVPTVTTRNSPFTVNSTCLLYTSPSPRDTR